MAVPAVEPTATAQSAAGSSSLTLLAPAKATYSLVLLALAGHFIPVLRWWLEAVRYPFGLDYGEGIVWQQALLIPSDRMYGPIDQFPAIVFHYPPLYHLAVRALASLGVDWLLSGRIISFIATLLIGGLIAALTFQATQGTGKPVQVIAAALAALITFTYIPVIVFAPLMRVDMLASALSLLGIYCAVCSLRRPGLLYCSMCSFALAVFTKQTAIAAPLATVPIMLLIDPRRTMRAVFFVSIIAVAVLALLTWQTNGGFLRHLFLYNINRYSISFAMAQVWRQAPHAIYLLLAIIGVALAARAVRSGDIRQRSTCILAILMAYFAIGTVMLIAVGKSGASVNYFIDWMCAWSVLIGYLVAWLLTEGNNRSALALGGAFVLLLQIGTLPLPPRRAFADQAGLVELQGLRERVHEAAGPVLSDDMVLLIKAGRPVLWEPAIFTELTAMGRWDQTPLLAMLHARKFAFVVTTGGPGEPAYDSRYTPEITAAIAASYPRAEKLAGRIIHLPPVP